MPEFWEKPGRKAREKVIPLFPELQILRSRAASRPAIDNHGISNYS
jgi:hypothetical protein